MNLQDKAAFSPRAAINPDDYLPYNIYSSLIYEDKLDLVSSYPFITSYTYLAEIADFCIPTIIDTPYAYSIKPIPTLDTIFDNAVIYCSNWSGPREYLVKLLEQSDKRVFIIFGHSIDTVGNEYSYFIEKLRVLHIFTQNCTNTDRCNFTPIPLGHEGKHIKKHGRASNSTTLLTKYQNQRLPIHLRDDVILSAFSLNTNTEERHSCLKSALKNEKVSVIATGNISTSEKNTMETFYKRLTTHKYILCPWGAAYDTHRFWQSLYLGCIPITRYCPAYIDFVDMGAIFLDNWEELNDKELMREKTNKAIGDMSKNKYYFDFWRSKIESIISEKSK